jgi:archaellum biogenesis ATPase FlaH
MIDIAKIKSAFTIVEMAERYNAQPYGSGKTLKTKFNPLRDEKTSSLMLYPYTNSFNDFGGSGGSIIDFVMRADGLSTNEAINKIKDMAGLIDIEPIVKKKSDYIEPEIVDKIWKQQPPLDFKTDHGRRELLAIAPEHIYSEAKEEDKKALFDIVKYDRHHDTACILLQDEHKISRSLRYRRFKKKDENGKFNGEEVKWGVHGGTQSSFPYIRIKNNDIVLIVEGTHDYLTAILAGYNVIAIPSSNFQLSDELLKDRLCLFIDDDDGKNFMRPLFDNSTSSKIWFDHAKFKEDNQIIKAKDFSDYLEQFETLKDFQIAMDHFISSQKVQSHGWEHAINKITTPITHKAILEAANMDWLIDDALIKNNITTLVGAPNVGKSAFSFAVVNKLFADGKIDKLLYFDADNPISYVKDRIIKLIDTHGEDKVNYYNGLNSSAKEMNEVLEVLSNVRNGGDRTIIIIDSLKFFINGSMNEDKLVSPFFDMLKAIRDRFGTTILCLHHTRKSKDDEGRLTYNGSQVVEASTDNMVMLTKEFIYHKKSRSDRAGLKFEISLNFEEMSFNLSDAVEEGGEENEKDDKTQIYADKIYDYLVEKNESVKQTQITEDLKDFVPRRKVKEVLWNDEYKSKLWNFTKGEGKTWLFASIRKSNPLGVVTEYEYDIDIDSIGLF